MESLQIIEFIAALVGVLYIWLEIKANKWLWVVGIILPILYIYISWKSQVYGNVVVNIMYILLSIYGLQAWRNKKEKPQEDQIQYIEKRLGYFVLSLTFLCAIAIGPALRRFTDSPFPYVDAFATSLCFVGMWLLAQKYMEHWYCWLISNIIFCALYLYQGFTITGIIFALYTVMAVLGYYNWRKLMITQKTNEDKSI